MAIQKFYYVNILNIIYYVLNFITFDTALESKSVMGIVRPFEYISIRFYNTIRNENYSSKFSCNTKRLIIIGIVASNTDIRMFKYSNIRIYITSLVKTK
jgi:hypothetical protein